MIPRSLVVYFSRTGHTKQVATSIAAALAADLEEIVDPTSRSGVTGYLRSGLEAAFHRLVPIGPTVREPSQYDLVVVGSPVWNMSVASPVRSYLHRHRNEFSRIAFFCTCGGRGGERAFDQMARVGRMKPVSTLVVREADVASSGAAIARFAADLSASSIGGPAPLRVAQPNRG